MSGAETAPPRIAIPEPNSQQPDYTARTLPQYEEAIRQAGGVPIPISLGCSSAEIATIVATCSGVVLPGSPADVNPGKYGEIRDPHTAAPDPARENADELLLQDAFNLRKPLLTICYGTQSLNVWRSGTLVQHLAEGPCPHRAAEGNASHAVAIHPGSLLADITGSSPEVLHKPEGLHLTVNSSHHQAIARPGDSLRVVARSPIDAVIEAVEGTQPDHFVLGLQWHPERNAARSAASRQIFAAFLRAASAWHLRPPQPGV
jgi:putative glutamine amidotransferase